VVIDNTANITAALGAGTVLSTTATYGITFSFVDFTVPGALEDAVKSNPKTKLVWLETPTNPTLTLIDLAAVSAIAKARGLISVCDNTFMSPYFQRPLELGIDVVTHSTTKYLNGHSDVVGGFVCMCDAGLAQRIAFLQNAVGAIPGPMDSFLVLRGVKTLSVRMERHAQNAARIAEFLTAHPKVSRVLWPGLPTHPQHALAKRLMTGFGGMMSFELRGGGEAARAVLKRVKVFSCAESLGGVESLLGHPATMTHASIPKERRERLGITDGLIRLSAGIEDVRDLIDDLAQAFDAA
jgi:cystathionine gamma-lyase